jgi:hypothetical protein
MTSGQKTERGAAVKGKRPVFAVSPDRKALGRGA